MDLQPRISPDQRPLLAAALRQSQEILQMPQTELYQWLLNQIDRNPLLESKGPVLAPLSLTDQEIASPISLYDHLQAQIRDAFSSLEERKIAEELLHQLDEKGFLTPPLSSASEKILPILQTFDPPGIFATSLQECLLIQLKFYNQTHTPAYVLVKERFQDLLAGRYHSIKKTIPAEDLALAIRRLSQLQFRPASAFRSEHAPPVFPDLKITKMEKKWKIEIPENSLPLFEIRNYPLEGMNPEEKRSVREWSSAAKWVSRCIERRRKLLLSIGAYIVRKQSPYLNMRGPLRYLTIQELAAHLGLHESTLSRAISGKYADTPRGILPLRDFFSLSPQAKTSKDILEQLIGQEDREHPLTDDELARVLQTKGFKIARRTIAKYRKELKIGSARDRPYSSRKAARELQQESAPDTKEP